MVRRDFSGLISVNRKFALKKKNIFFLSFEFFSGPFSQGRDSGLEGMYESSFFYRFLYPICFDNMDFPEDFPEA